MDIVFCDLETTGLDPNRHAIVEIALIKGEEVYDKWIKLTVQELAVAESIALKVNQYWARVQDVEDDRVVDSGNFPRVYYSRQEAAYDIAQFTDGCILAGNNVKFDQQFLEVWLRKHGACPTWDYHVLDVPTYAAGFLTASSASAKPPFKSSFISQALRVPEPDEAHTAMGDALWSKRIWEACNR